MDNTFWNRRSFLKTVLAGTFLLLSRPAFATSLPSEPAEPGEIDEMAEMDGPMEPGEMDAEAGLNGAWEDGEPLRPFGDRPEGRLLLYNPRSNERLDVTYRDPSGRFDREALSSVDRFMRCHYTKQQVKMDIRVIEYLNAVDKRLGGGNEIHVISAYRSPEYNEYLRRRSRRVAKKSLHLSGMAVDFRIPGVSLKKIRNAAMDMRLGGVGYYPTRGFLHLDSGRFRHW